MQRSTGNVPKSGLAAVALVLAAALVSLTAAAQAPKAQTGQSEAEWKAVEQALGKSGQLQDGGVFRIGMPRTDLKVTVQGVEVKPGFALGSYAAFKPTGNTAMVMGDLVLLDEEVPDVMAGLLANSFAMTALHNHLNEISPHVMYLHFLGRGNAVELARGLREALARSKTPLGDTSTAASPSPGGSQLDQEQIEAALGRSGKLNNGVLQVSVPRAERITENGMELLPAMGVTTALNFQPTGEGKAAITGDFVLIAREVSLVAKTLREHGVQVTALHNHALGDNPRLFYMHFWANDDAVKLARALRLALARTHSKPAQGTGK